MPRQKKIRPTPAGTEQFITSCFGAREEGRVEEEEQKAGGVENSAAPLGGLLCLTTTATGRAKIIKHSVPDSNWGSCGSCARPLVALPMKGTVANVVVCFLLPASVPTTPLSAFCTATPQLGWNFQPARPDYIPRVSEELATHLALQTSWFPVGPHSEYPQPADEASNLNSWSNKHQTQSQ